MELLQPTPHLPPLEALTQGRADSWVLPVFAEQKPPRGWLGRVDWECLGWVSHLLREGHLEGSLGEWTWIPILRPAPLKPARILLFGCGPHPDAPDLPDARTPSDVFPTQMQKRYLTQRLSLLSPGEKLLWTRDAWNGWQGPSPERLAEGLIYVRLD